MTSQITAIIIICALLLIANFGLLNCQDYNDTQSIFTDLLASSRYHTDVIPISNQSNPIDVVVFFDLISIVSVDDITQAFTCNGVFTFLWTDERLMWNASQYGGQHFIHPVPKRIWRPRVVLVNTLEARDPFQDDISPVIVSADGSAQWIPGSLFVTSCSLSLLKYPFDEQLCSITMLSMGLNDAELIFLSGGFGTGSFPFSVHGEWQLIEGNITTHVVYDGLTSVPQIEVFFRIKRRSTFYILNIILPVVFLSLLNMVVFCIPVESGEKISYGITVVLAISVFLSQVSALLPRSSTEVPYVTIYLFTLFLVSVLTVLDTILIVFLHHLEEKAVFKHKVFRRYEKAVDKITIMRRVVASLTNETQIESQYSMTNPEAMVNKFRFDQKTKPEANGTSGQKMQGDKGTSDVEGFQNRQRERRNNNCGDAPSPYKLVGDHIDLFSFIIFMTVWIVITMWYFIAINV